jgi:DegV family protein with EDD domain
MSKVAVITDTNSSLSAEMARTAGISMVPITIHFGEKTYTTGVDINDKLLFEIVDHTRKLPTTSAPSPAAFAAAYREAFDSGAEEIVCICVSSQMSSTYNSAVTACEEFPGRKIAVVDSLNLSMAEGYMAYQAVEWAQQGLDAETIAARLPDMNKRLHLFALLPTLKYLAMSGRVGKFVAGLADTFNIKPILTVKDGRLVLLERIRVWSKAQDRMLELTSQAVSGKKIEKLILIHVNNPVGLVELEKLLRERIACPSDIPSTEFSTGLSVHAGSGVIGLVVLTAE